MGTNVKVGQNVIFTSHEDKAWGEKYGGRTATVNEVINSEVTITFEDGLELTVQDYEVMVIGTDLGGM